AVRRFLAGGASVACLDRDGEALTQLDGIAAAARLVADVTDSSAVLHAVEQAAAQMGGIDGVVNSAGIDLVAGVESMTDEAWERLMAVNLAGPMKVCRAAVPHLRQAGGGTIVNVSSG